jgi:hypothetical protein
VELPHIEANIFSSNVIFSFYLGFAGITTSFEEGERFSTVRL